MKTLNNFIRKLFYLDKWYLKIFSKNTDDILPAKFICDINIKSKYTFYADPFILSEENGVIEILVEKFNYFSSKGIISKIILKINEKKHLVQDILIERYHLSFPYVISQNKFMPEASESLKTRVYFQGSSGIESSILHNKSCIDPALFNFDRQEYLFFTARKYPNNHLKVYNLKKKSMVKNVSSNYKRMAGNFFLVNGSYFRPSQTSYKCYGDSVIISKVKEISDKVYKEHDLFTIAPKLYESKAVGLHHYSVGSKFIVLDINVPVFSLIALPLKLLQRFKIYVRTNKSI